MPGSMLSLIYSLAVLNAHGSSAGAQQCASAIGSPFMLIYLNHAHIYQLAAPSTLGAVQGTVSSNIDHQLLYPL
eukprot:scaffold63057_cov21-Tisochrysis_lutea.AAC.1